MSTPYTPLHTVLPHVTIPMWINIIPWFVMIQVSWLDSDLTVRFLVRFCVSDMYGLTIFGLEPDSVERVVYIPDLTLIVMSQGRHVYLTFPFPTYTGQLSFRLTSRARVCRQVIVVK